jgi:hypothetical protein
MFHRRDAEDAGETIFIVATVWHALSIFPGDHHADWS